MVFWCQVVSNREEMCKQIEDLRGEANIIPLVLRGLGFDHPNALLSDLNKLICEHKEQFEAKRFRATTDSPLALLLLSRTEFVLPQISSLTVLPEWFPRVGGQSASIAIEDLTRTADGPINMPEAHIGELSEKLFRLDVSVVSRLTQVALREPRLGQAVFDAVKKPDEKFMDFLTAARNYHADIRNPQGFRPSVREGRSFVSRLLYLMQTTTPEQIGRRAKALAMALDIEDNSLPPVDDSIISVILRPTNRDAGQATRFARNIIVTVYASSQFITAAAHADDYPNYPVLLLRSLSYNLRATLDGLTRAIDRLSRASDISG